METIVFKVNELKKTTYIISILRTPTEDFINNKYKNI